MGTVHTLSYRPLYPALGSHSEGSYDSVCRVLSSGVYTVKGLMTVCALCPALGSHSEGSYDSVCRVPGSGGLTVNGLYDSVWHLLS